MSRDSTFTVSSTRQNMFKYRTPPWKETYRKQCLDRLKESRNKQQSLRRHICFDNPGDAADAGATVSDIIDIDAIMKEEWRKLQSKHFDIVENDLNGDSSDEMFAFYESIHSEIRKELEADLIKEEQRLLSLQDICDKHIQEEEELCSALSTLSTDEVICPLCEKNILLEHMGVIVCKCGLRINTEQDCITLKNVKASLEAGTSEHSESCHLRPTFHLSQNFGISNLLMACEVCDFLFIIV
ncbi:RPA-interacting protein B-like [Biomphalaria glabrata]|uniref:RPA-interacting protein B-like n=2 Tax=Biomphalaria TaxID=6525 RepID=A0A9W2YGG3_BIOGL|nr:RPA-interacting protein B-like [Biomphalaria glabrata]XP_055861819.1 RPA-interacting protein B-like [Biomphalaria glabrata]KAK0068954.1 RPA-interacting protein [Biomphalaria pfeifferi]